MASIYKELHLDVPADELWRDLRDFGNPKTLWPNLIATVKVVDNQRYYTFANGSELREPLISIDDQHRRLAYYVAAGPAPLTHNNASMQVFDDNGGSRLVWITDLLPDEAAPPLEGELEPFIQELQATLAQRRA
jgi:hypothetical protein